MGDIVETLEDAGKQKGEKRVVKIRAEISELS